MMFSINNNPFVLAQNWLDAAEHKIDTRQRIELYKATNEMIRGCEEGGDLKKQYALCQTVLQTFEKARENRRKFYKFIQWVGEHTGEDSNGRLNGAYACLNGLFNTVAKVNCFWKVVYSDEESHPSEESHSALIISSRGSKRKRLETESADSLEVETEEGAGSKKHKLVQKSYLEKNIHLHFCHLMDIQIPLNRIFRQRK